MNCQTAESMVNRYICLLYTSGDIAVHTGEYCGSCDSVQEEIFLSRRIT